MISSGHIHKRNNRIVMKSLLSGVCIYAQTESTSSDPHVKAMFRHETLPLVYKKELDLLYELILLSTTKNLAYYTN